LDLDIAGEVVMALLCRFVWSMAREVVVGISSGVRETDSGEIRCCGGEVESVSWTELRWCYT
jgi:hypothetical protein